MAHELARELFFSEMRYTGVSVTKWAFARAGKQQDQFVATNGGTNTTYCDAECQAGDVLVADLPYSETLHQSLLGDVRPELFDPSDATSASHGFAKCQTKKGTPKEKMTLVVRPIPAMTPNGS